MKINMTDKKEPITEKEKELVIARLGVTSPDLHFSDGTTRRHIREMILLNS